MATLIWCDIFSYASNVETLILTCPMGLFTETTHDVHMGNLLDSDRLDKLGAIASAVSTFALVLKAFRRRSGMYIHIYICMCIRAARLPGHTIRTSDVRQLMLGMCFDNIPNAVFDSKHIRQCT
jgi:hypothetical protein